MISISTRRQIFAGLALLTLPPPVYGGTACWTTRVLFVCPMGSVKSAIAREKLRREAKLRGLAVDAHSRGVKPELDISAGLAAHLKEEGINPLADPLRQFVKTDADHADIVIAFDEAAMAPGLERARKWHSPSWNDDYANAKSVMDARIPALAEELSKRSC